MLISDAMYSLVLRVKACCSSSVKLYLQPIPVFGKKPPIPHSDESKKVVMVGFLKITLLTEMPYLPIPEILARCPGRLMCVFKA